MRAAIKDIEICILAGGRSNRFGQTNKALQLFDNKPFILHVIDRCLPLGLPIRVFTHTTTQLQEIQEILPSSIPVYIDQTESQGRTPLFGMLAAAKQAKSKWIFVLPCDAIRLQPLLLKYLISLIKPEIDAIIPRWSNQWIEPLLALYASAPLAHWIPYMLNHHPPELKLKLLLPHLSQVKFVEIEDLRNFDPDLASFVNINSVFDLVPVLDLKDPFSTKPNEH